MKTPNTITIDDTTYVREDSINSPALGELRIIAADRGWVFVGNCTDRDDGSVEIRNAKNIRRWGTSRGLGELTEGPTGLTVTDDYGTVVVKPIITIAVTGGW